MCGSSTGSGSGGGSGGSIGGIGGSAGSEDLTGGMRSPQIPGYSKMEQPFMRADVNESMLKDHVSKSYDEIKGINITHTDLNTFKTGETRVTKITGIGQKAIAYKESTLVKKDGKIVGHKKDSKTQFVDYDKLSNSYRSGVGKLSKSEQVIRNSLLK